MPVGVMPAAHMADLVGSVLKRRYPAADKCRHKIVPRHTLTLELDYKFVDLIDLVAQIFRIVLPVRMYRWRAYDELGEANVVDIGGVFNIEEGPELLLA